MPSFSRIVLLLGFTALFYAGFIYYPKWKKEGPEAVLSWDVSGYYFYLPAIWIFKDLKALNFRTEIQRKYAPADSQYQSFDHPSGNQVMKYSAGMALQYFPFFFVFDVIAEAGGWPRDGFSRPYQLGIALGSFLIAVFGLLLMRINLRRYFDDWIVGVALLILVFCTNYLEYAGITSAMTHNYLFTIYAALIFLTNRFYQKPGVVNAMCLGTLIGLATLTRPTEIIALLIPVLWAVDGRKAFLGRMDFLKRRLRLVLYAVATAMLVGSVQLIYWKFAAGDWLVYSYEDQGFSWLSPHLIDGLFSYKAGWLLYTPIMGLALIGFWFLFRRQRQQFYWSALFTLLFLYITYAWDIWWYGGSLGSRAMVQCYAVLLFPLAAIIREMGKRKWGVTLLVLLILGAGYYNIWMTHQAHRGGYFVAGGMNRAYFWNILAQWEPDTLAPLLLDTNEKFRKQPRGTQIIYENDFEAAPESCSIFISGQRSQCLTSEIQNSEIYNVPIPDTGMQWLRISTDVHCVLKEWEPWRMSQLAIRFKSGPESVKEKAIRPHRVLQDHQTRNIFFDTKIPDKEFDRIEIQLHNSGSNKTIIYDNLRVESFY